MHHLVMMSGGAGSWAAGKRVVERYGAENTTLLFADTKFEDEDTYRYLKEASENIGAKLEIVAEGRDIWQVFVDGRFMGNSRVDPCSAKLKRDVCDKWVKARYRHDEVIVYVGIDWTEEHRFKRLAERVKPYVYDAPLLWEPKIAKPQIMEWSKAEGLKQQRLYDIGMPHANCGGGCVKAADALRRDRLIGRIFGKNGQSVMSYGNPKNSGYMSKLKKQRNLGSRCLFWA